jgi:hypothetical protein
MSLTASPTAPSHWRRYRSLYLLLAVCIAPVIASYTAYYALPPSGRTNYGDLIEPQRPASSFSVKQLDGTADALASLRGQWVMIQLAPAACDEFCRQRLWVMRQVRATTGKDRDRVARVWLLTDGAVPDAALLREYEGTRVLRADPAQVRALLPTAGASIEDHLWLMDPLGNLMLRWPKDADPNRMKKDLSRVLRASRIG